MATEPSSDSGSLRVTLKDVNTAVQTLALDVAEIKGSTGLIAQSVQTMDARITDHEGRLRALEAWRYALPASIIVGFMSLGATVIVAVIK